MKIKLLACLLLLSVAHIGWFGPKTSTGTIASQDVYANSSDTHSIGTSSNYWKNGYFAYLKMSEHTANEISNTPSFGVIFVSSDNFLYYVNDSGTKYSINVTAV